MAIYGTDRLAIRSADQARNLLDMADLARSVGLVLDDDDQRIELSAFQYLRRHYHDKDTNHGFY